MIVIEAVFEAFAGRRDEFVALTLRTMVAPRRENGCVLYRFTADLEHPNRFTLIELWETEEDLKAHHVAEAFKNFFAELPSKGKSVSHSACQGPLVPFAPPNREK